MTDQQVGKAGEYMVCADLLLKGFNVTMAAEGLPYDIILDTGEVLLKVQVKTNLKPKWIHGSLPDAPPRYVINLKVCGKKYKKRYKKGEIDIYAVVGIEEKCVGYISDEMNLNTLNLKSESYRGKYLDEIRMDNRVKMEAMVEQGLPIEQISQSFSIQKYSVSKYLKYKPKWSRTIFYFSEIQRDKEWFLNLAKSKVDYGIKQDLSGRSNTCLTIGPCITSGFSSNVPTV